MIQRATRWLWLLQRSRFRSIGPIKQAAIKKMKSGAVDKSTDMTYLESFEWGLKHNFANAEVEWEVLA